MQSGRTTALLKFGKLCQKKKKHKYFCKINKYLRRAYRSQLVYKEYSHEESKAHMSHLMNELVNEKNVQNE